MFMREMEIHKIFICVSEAHDLSKWNLADSPISAHQLNMYKWLLRIDVHKISWNCNENIKFHEIFQNLIHVSELITLNAVWYVRP